MSEEVVREMTVEELIEKNRKYLSFIEDRYKEMEKRCEKLNDRCGYIELNSYNEGFADAYKEGIAKGEQSMQEKVNKMLEFREHTSWVIIQDIFGEKTALVDFISNINEYYNKIIEYEKKEQEETEIHVGDEVIDKYGKKYIVRALNVGHIHLLGRNGEVLALGCSDVSKTGKHYPLEEMLKELEG